MSQPENKITLPFSESHAFIIGINNYRHGISVLKSAVKDARDMAELLRDTHGYKVHLTIDATKDDMYKVFEKMKTVVKPKDRVIFYFAGHGYASDSETDPEGFLIPADASKATRNSFLPMKDLHATIKTLKCKHGLLILDCCFSGSFRWSTTRGGFDLSGDEPLYEERFYRFLRNDAWQVITSAAHDQKAIDIFADQALGMRDEDGEEEEPNSPFAKALKKAIDLQGAADTARGNRSDGVITASELYTYLRDIVETETAGKGKRQTPSIFTLNRHDKGEFIFLHPGHRLNLVPAPDTNPYKGLQPYSVEESAFFFGREKAIKELAKKLEQTPILVISAPSGQGKSSTVKAGLFPYLKKHHNYKTLSVLRPGEDPAANLRLLPSPVETDKAVILLDQYEEFFTDAPYGESHGKFEDKIIETYKFAMKSKTKIIITIRADFEWQLKESKLGKEFWDNLKIRKFLYRLAPMSLDELKQIMIKPAWVVAYDFESDEMVDHILEEINHSPGALPILSFTLSQLYKYRDQENRKLSQDSYTNKLGGINGALSTHANKIFEKLKTDDHKTIMRLLFLRMIRLNDGSYSRRRVYRELFLNGDKLNELAFPKFKEATVDDVLDILVEEQLISGGSDDLGSYFEPTHDALINFWPKCLNWINKFGKEHISLQRQLWQAILDYYKRRSSNKGNQQQNGDHQGAAIGSDGSSFLWYNNPKLRDAIQSVIDPEGILENSDYDHILEGTALIWNDDTESTVNRQKTIEAVTWWEQKTGISVPLEYYLKNPDEIQSGKVLEFILSSKSSWLNKEEYQFVIDSWKKRTEWITKLKTDRDNAIKAQKEAEAARQRTIDEMIEASWKTATYLGEADQSGAEGARKLYQKLKLIMSLSKAQSLSPFKIFTEGPHSEIGDFDLQAKAFGYYNPEFVKWAKDNVLPAKNNAFLKKVTQPFYNKYLRDMARTYYLTYEQLERKPDLCKNVQKDYLTYLQTGKIPNNKWPGYESGGLFFESQIGIWPFPDEISEKAGIEVNNPYYHWVVSLGFWIRRHIDTTALTFKEIMDDLLRTYDTDWFNNPPDLPTYY
ncbi:MAG: caspase family protein [Bacteroidota bacterium]